MTHPAYAAHIPGFPRMGQARELKFAMEAFWRGDIAAPVLQEVGSQLRSRHWALQKQAGLDWVSVGDFAWYDHVLSTLALLGAIPPRFGFAPQHLDLQQYFVLARGNQQQPAMEMTKWFDTNYHFLVPEWQPDTRFDGGMHELFDEVSQAQQLGHAVKVVLLGPLSLLYLGKLKADAQGRRLQHKLDLLPAALAAYQRVLARLKQAGVAWVQIDEPILALDLPREWLEAFLPSYTALSPCAPSLLLASYFGGVQEHARLLHSLPVAGLHLDLQRAPEQLATLLADWPAGRVLSAGIIDGRNVWRADLPALLAQLHPLQQQLGEALWISSSCSLLHVPMDLQAEAELDDELRSWLAFATQKLDEIQALRLALRGEMAQAHPAFEAARAACASRRHSARIHNRLVQQRLTRIQPTDSQRDTPFIQRYSQQQQRFQLPLFPTTTIGSFPQTSAIRSARAAHKRGELGALDYLQQMRACIAHAIHEQEALGLDVLVHGEAERNDMVEYFAEHLWGYAFTQHAWVQSYGSRCVKPPLLYGDIYRPEAMTVEWSKYAQSLSRKPVKGMLTGPVTMLQWSFVRDDQPRAQTAMQLALALREEVLELQAAGIGMIQIDEPALREGLPLRQRDWPAYLEWAVQAFGVTAGGVRADTQIHTHMCYSEFHDILPWIAAMDADVITIETSRSDMELLEAFAEFAYPNQIGPGVYDIHSPRIPDTQAMLRLLEKALLVIPAANLWVNPDCGLKTRGWPETRAALQNMVEAATLLRHRFAEKLAHSELASAN